MTILAGILGTVTGAAVLLWPLYQSDLPGDFGAWPLHIAVMGFTIAMWRLAASAIDHQRASYHELLESQRNEFIGAITSAGKETTEAIREQTKTITQLRQVRSSRAKR